MDCLKCFETLPQHSDSIWRRSYAENYSSPFGKSDSRRRFRGKLNDIAWLEIVDHALELTVEPAQEPTEKDPDG